MCTEGVCTCLYVPTFNGCSPFLLLQEILITYVSQASRPSSAALLYRALPAQTTLEPSIRVTMVYL